LIERLKRHAGQLKTELYALYLAYRDPRVPWVARVVAACVVGYAFSPIDLIPDFIPVIGYLDDLILVPLGIKLAIGMIPENVMSESRVKAQAAIQQGMPVNWVAAAIIMAVWIGIAAAAVVWLVQKFR
jgi:uncharacterized membrane protein YkvA (DUF1232 family)